MQDLYVIAPTVFTFGLTLLMAMKIYEGLNAYDFFAASPAMAAIGRALSIMDYGAVFLVVGLFVTSIILASRIRTSPVFFPVSLLFWLWLFLCRRSWRMCMLRLLRQVFLRRWRIRCRLFQGFCIIFRC